MSLNKSTHDLPEHEGQPVFIVEAHQDVSRRIMGITFTNGVAQMIDPARARQFDENFGYRVTAPTGFPRWKNAVHDSIVSDDWDDEENDVVSVSTESWA